VCGDVALRLCRVLWGRGQGKGHEACEHRDKREQQACEACLSCAPSSHEGAPSSHEAKGGA